MELMIDIESLGTTAGSPVVTIGAVLFDPYSCDSSEVLANRALNIRIDVSDSVNLSRGVEGGTLRWWFEQKDEAIKALIGSDCVSMQEALLKLWRYCHERGAFVNKEFFEGLSNYPKTNRYWAKDPDFDMQLMRYYYEHPSMDAHSPWKFWECRSVRTVQDLAWPNGSSERPDFNVPGVAHDARYDAITQAMMVQSAMHRLNLSKDQDVDFDKFK
jgi:exodeoxyribonuclease VIII